MLSVDELLVRRGGRPVVRVSGLVFAVGSHVVAGANGSGKSSLLTALAGLLPWQGSVRVGGLPLGPGAAGRVGFLPQSPGGLDHLSVGDGLSYAQVVLGGRRDAGAAAALLEEVGLGGLGGRRIGRLSGGQRHLAYLAMALAHRPEVLLLDEPTSGLDAEHRTLLRDAVLRLAEHLVVVTATHLPDDIAVLGQRVVVLRQGEVAFQGDAGQLRQMGGAEAAGGSALDAALVRLERGQ